MNIWVDLPHVVYRCYDAEGTLLYIGHTHSIESRLSDHRGSKNMPSALLSRWMVRHTVEEYPSKADAANAERRAIWFEQPVFNTANQQVGNRTATRRPIVDAYVAYAEQRTADALAALEAAA